MTRKFLACLAVIGFLAGAGAAFAHHGTNVSYDPTKETSLTGVVTKYVWANPHSQMFFEVKGPDGKVVTWGGELHSIGLLTRAGWTRNTIKPGDTVIVRGNPSRAGTPYMVVLEVVLNGKSYFRDLPEQGAGAQ